MGQYYANYRPRKLFGKIRRKKKGFLNQKAVTIKNAQQILTFEKVRINTDR